MKILLVQPKMNKRPMDIDLKTRMSPSLSLLTLLNLTLEGHETIIINENIQNIDFDCGADMVGITITLDVMPRACQIAAEFMRRGTPVIAGGIHVTCCPEDCLPHFNSICIGPAERVWAKIIKDVKSSCLQREYCDVKDFRGDEIVSPRVRYIKQNKYLYNNVV